MAKCVNDDSIDEQATQLSMLLVLVCFAALTVAFLLAIFLPPHILADQCMRSHLPQLMLKYFKSDLNLFISNDVMWCIIFFVVLLIHTFCSDKIFIYWIKFMYFVHHSVSCRWMSLCVCLMYIVHKQRKFYENITIDIEYNIWLEPFPFCLLLLVANGQSDIEVRTSILCDVSDNEKKNGLKWGKRVHQLYY